MRNDPRSWNTRVALVICAAMLVSTLHDSLAEELELPNPRHGDVYVVAHRGAHQGIPENTIAAYQRAIELGCDFVEIDIRTTKDGAFVSIHNATVDAYTSDAQGSVRDFSLAELKAMDIGSRVDPKWRDERIPTLNEILSLCKGKIGIYLDLKDGDVTEIAQIVLEYEMQKHTLWYASQKKLLELQRACPTCLPMPDPGPESRLSRVIAELNPPPKVVASVMRHCSPTFVEKVHDAGAIIITDEKDPSSWAALLDWGNDGIQTDHPEKLIEFIQAHEN